MSRPPRYPLTEQLVHVCQLLEVDPRDVLRRAGLPEDLHRQEGVLLTGAKHFELWNAFEIEARRPDMAFELGIIFVQTQFSVPQFAFSCSENLDAGLTRFSEFKPLMGPKAITLERGEDTLSVTFSSAEPGIALPDSLSLFELTYIVECARSFTAEHIVPLLASSPAARKASPEMVAHLGVRVTEAPETRLTFSRADTLRPFGTRNDSLWEAIEPGLRQRLASLHAEGSMRGRVKAMLWETLAGGGISADQIARRLNVSKRSLQRRLTEEGVTFKDVLTETRTELCERYLRQSDLSLTEIAFLVGFRDPTSFFRAFQAWTGKTPAQARRAYGA